MNLTRLFLGLVFLAPLVHAPLAQAKRDPEVTSAPWTEDQPVIKSLTKLLPELRRDMLSLKPGDLLVLDLDNTVFREAQTLGTDEWYTHQIAKLTAQGLTEREAKTWLEVDNAAIKNASRMRLMERGLPRWIAKLQGRGVFVMALTARHPNLAPATLRQLAELGIHFEASPKLISVPEGFAPVPDHEFLWQGGVAFTDGSPKGDIVKTLVARMGIVPHQAFAIDDRIHHVHSFAEAFSDLHIPAQVIHYLRALEEKFDPVLADRQYDHFRRTGQLLSDNEVRARLHCEDRLR